MNTNKSIWFSSAGPDPWTLYGGEWTSKFLEDCHEIGSQRKINQFHMVYYSQVCTLYRGIYYKSLYTTRSQKLLSNPFCLSCFLSGHGRHLTAPAALRGKLLRAAWCSHGPYNFSKILEKWVQYLGNLIESLIRLLQNQLFGCSTNKRVGRDHVRGRKDRHARASTSRFFLQRGAANVRPLVIQSITAAFEYYCADLIISRAPRASVKPSVQVPGRSSRVSSSPVHSPDCWVVRQESSWSAHAGLSDHWNGMKNDI